MKIGVLGSAGSIGSRHAANLSALGHEVIHFDPAGRMDLRFEREVYEHCDAVVIATPSVFHQSAIRAAAERGKHIFVEKPIGTTCPDVYADVLAMAKRNGCAVMVGYNCRFLPAVIDAKRALVDGKVGVPLFSTFVCSQFNIKYIDDVVLNWSHEIDLSLSLLGRAYVVHAFSLGTSIDVVLRQVGRQSVVHLDYIADPQTRTFQIVGSDGSIFVDLGALPQAVWDESYVTEMRAFIDRCAGKETLGATAEDGLAVMNLCLDARKMAGLPI